MVGGEGRDGRRGKEGMVGGEGRNGRRGKGKGGGACMTKQGEGKTEAHLHSTLGESFW